VSIELAWDEIKAAMVSFGFSLDSERFDIRTTYAGAPETLMSTVYKYVARASFFFKSLIPARVRLSLARPSYPVIVVSFNFSCVFSVATKTSDTTPTGGWEPTVLAAIVDAGRKQQQKHLQQAPPLAQTQGLQAPAAQKS
jgi:hypothetical protein